MKRLKVPGTEASLKRLSVDEKSKAIIHQLEHLASSANCLWYKQEASTILVAHLRESLPATLRTEVFGGVDREADLLDPVVKHFVKKGFEVFAEVPMGRNRADVAAIKPGFLWGKTVVAVELKNQLEQLKRATDQLTTFSDYAHETYLACTPLLAHDYLRWHAKSAGATKWDSNCLARKLSKIGAGLLLVDDGVTCVHAAKSGSPESTHLQDVIASAARLPRKT